jgi:hypothetical protein
MDVIVTNKKDEIIASIINDSVIWEDGYKVYVDGELVTEPKVTELFDTIELMCSDDYKDRFKAEYYQLKIRYDKLMKMLSAWDKGELNFTPTCPRSMYDIQVKGMEIYLDILYDRAELEKVDLNIV